MYEQTRLTKGEQLWIGVIFFSVVLVAAEAPYSLTFHTRLQSWQIWSDLIISSIFIADLIRNFRRLKKKQRKGTVQTSELSNDRILSTIIDVLACIPCDVIFWLLGASPTSWIKFIRLFRLIRVVKIFTVMNNLTLIPKWLKIQILLFSSLIIIHWFTCVWIMIYPPGDSSAVEYYVKSFYWTVTTLTTVGYGDISPTTTGGRIYTMVVMLVGVGVYGVVIGNVSRIFAESARYKEQTREKFSDLSAFMKHYQIPSRLQGEVFNYYNHLFTKRLSDNDQKIISELPQALKHELQIYMNMKLIRNLPVFKFCSQACLKEIAAALEQRYYGPHDYIIRIGEVGDEMFVIGHGTVDVIIADGNTVAQLHEGQFFGEAALLKETTRNANVRATTYCDLYRLAKDDFLRIIKSYPELLESMESVTNKRGSDSKKKNS